MVYCTDCKFCIEMQSDVDNRKSSACVVEYKDLLNEDSPEYWTLFDTGVLDKIVEVNPFKERICHNYEPRFVDTTNEKK